MRKIVSLLLFFIALSTGAIIRRTKMSITTPPVAIENIPPQIGGNRVVVGGCKPSDPLCDQQRWTKWYCQAIRFHKELNIEKFSYFQKKINSKWLINEKVFNFG